MNPLCIEEAHDREVRTQVDRIASDLQQALGQRLVAYVTQNRSPKVVGRWARGEGEPQDDDAKQRLRGLYRTWLILASTEEPPTIRNWLLGANPHLGDQAPIELLREGDSTKVQRAAQEFVRDGDSLTAQPHAEDYARG
jgi:hypothetical protein